MTGARALCYLALLGAVAGEYSSIAAGLEACGTPCLRAGQGSTLESSLSVSPWEYDAEYNLVLDWSTALTSGSLLSATGATISGNVYAVLGNATSLYVSKISPLFTASTLASDGFTPIPSVTSWPASSSPVTLDPFVTFFVDALTPCPDNVVLELIIGDATGNAVAGGTFYSPMFSWCGGIPNFPVITVTSPMEANFDALPAQIIAGETLLTVNWTAQGVPWTQGFDIHFQGLDFNYNAVPALDSQGALVGLQVVGIPPSSPVSSAVHLNTNQDGTGVAYSASFTLPSNASGCILYPVVTATVDPASYLGQLWSGTNVGYGDAVFTALDPVSLSTSITLISPAYQSLAQPEGSLALAWSGVGLKSSDTLYLTVVNLDSPSPSDFYVWYLGPTDASLGEDVTPLAPTLDPTTTSTLSVTLAPFHPATTPRGYFFNSSSAPTALAPGINYQASLTIFRPTFSVTGSSNYFKVLASSPATLTVTLPTTFPSPAYWNSTVTLAYSIANFNAATMKTLSVSLWLSSLGIHSPDSDREFSALALVPAAASGTLTLTLPSDVRMGLVSSAHYFFGVQVVEAKEASAASPYFALIPPALTITAPSYGVTAHCGGSVVVSWTASGLPSSSTSLSFDLYTLDATSGRDVLYGPLARGVAPGEQSITLNLPTAMTRGSYTIYAYSGPSFGESTAATTSSYSPFAITCPPVIRVGAFFPSNNITAGELLTLSYTATNLPLNAPLTVALIKNSTGTLIRTLTTTETYKGYFMIPTDPDTAYAGVTVKVSDTSDPTSFGLSPQALTVTVPRTRLSITAPLTWKAGSKVSFRLSAQGFPSASNCTLALYSYASELTGPQWLQSVGGAFPCATTKSVDFTPPTSLPTLPYYYATVVESSTLTQARTAPATLTGGAEAGGISTLRGEGSGTSAAPSPSCASTRFPATAAWAAPALCASTCESCAAAGGVWLTAAPTTLTLGFSPWVGTQADQAAFAAQLGAFSATDSLCWPAPHCNPALSPTTFATQPQAYTPCPGSANVYTSLSLGVLPWVQAAFYSALNISNPATSTSPLVNMTINATLSVVAATPGTTNCAATAGASFTLAIGGLTPPAVATGTGGGCILQDATPDSPSVTVNDVCVLEIARLVAAAPRQSPSDFFCAISAEGAPVVSAAVPASTAPVVTAPSDRLWDVIIVGAGGSGIAAAATALRRNLTVLMLEGRPRTGGRVVSDRSWDLPVPSIDQRLPGVTYETGTVPTDLGASWVHGMTGNVLMTLVKRFNIPYIVTPYSASTLFFANGTRASSATAASLDAAFAGFAREVAEWTDANVIDEDVPLQTAVDAVLSAGLASGAYSEELAAFFRYYVVSLWEHEMAADASTMSAWHWDASARVKGDDCVFPLGYDQVLSKWFAADVAPYTGNFTLLLGSTATAVDTTGYASGTSPVTVTAQDTTKGTPTQYRSRSIIVTVPLGVLKKGAIAFTPPLSAPVATAVSRLGMGLLNKYAFEAAIPDSPLWYNFPTSDPDDAFMFNRAGANKEDSTFAEYVNFQYVSRRAAENPAYYAAGARQSRYIIGFASGAAAAAQSLRSDAEVAASITSNLKAMFPSITGPTRFKRTSWDLDPFSYGSYSYQAVGSLPSDRAVFLSSSASAGTGCPGLLFAGEHASKTDPGTLHGAIDTGTVAGAAIQPSAYTGPTSTPRRRRLSVAEVGMHMRGADWARHLATQAPRSSELAESLTIRLAALSKVIHSGNLHAALELARAARGFSRALLPAGSEGLLEQWWPPFTSSRVASLSGTTRAGGEFTRRLVTLPDGRTLPLHSLGSVFSGGLPVVGLNLPMSGFELQGEFYADTAGHECSPGQGGVGVVCTIGGAPPQYFPSESHAERAVVEARQAGMAAYHGEHKLPPPPPSHAWSAANHYAALGAEGEMKQGGVRALSRAATDLLSYAEPYTNNKMTPVSGEAMTSAGFTGNRTTLIISVVWHDYVWDDATSPKDPSLVPLSTVHAAAADFRRVGLRSFGKLTPVITVSPCIYRLPPPFTLAFANDPATGPDSAPWISLMRHAATEAVRQGFSAAVNTSTLTACPALDPSTFHNFAIIQPHSFNCPWGGVALAPGSLSLYNAQPNPSNPTASLDNLAMLLWHEIGHNYGFLHSSTRPAALALANTSTVEYGDYMTNLGSGGVAAFADFLPNCKHAAGWIDDAYVVPLARQRPFWTGTAMPTFYTSASFTLAAYDREYTSYDANSQLSELPAGTALAARAAVPPSWTAYGRSFMGDGYARNDPFFLYIGYYGANASWARPYLPTLVDGKQISGPGIYLRSTYVNPTQLGHTMLTCYRDSSCSTQYPLEPHDAMVYEPEGIALLVEAGAFKPLFPANPATSNSPTQNGGVATSVTYLLWNGSSVDPTYPQKYFPAYATADPALSTPITPLTASLSRGTAVFLFMPRANTNIIVTPSCSGTPGLAGADPSLVGFSFFIGAFPTSHALYGGNVGYSGDGNVPSCSQPFAFQAGPDSPVWVVAANRGQHKALKTSVNVTLAYAPAASFSLPSVIATSTVYHPTQFTIQGMCNGTNAGDSPYYLEYSSNAFPSGGFTVDPAGCSSSAIPYLAAPISGPSRFPGVTYTASCNPAHPVYTATSTTDSGGAVVYCANTYDSPTCTWVLGGFSMPGLGYSAELGYFGEPICFLQQPPQRLVASCALAGSAPQYPLSPTQLSGGQSTGLPPPHCALASPCPVGQWSDTGSALHCRCPLGWTYNPVPRTCSGRHLGGPLAIAPTTASTYENFSPITCLGKTITLFDGTLLSNCVPKPTYPIVEADCIDTEGLCLFFWSSSASAYQRPGSVFAWHRTVDPTSFTVSWNSNAGIGPQLAPSALFPSWTAFCAPGASTLDWAGSKACYCGPGNYAHTAPGTSVPYCTQCPAGFFRGIGGAEGSGGDASRNEACTPCATGLVSPLGAEACEATCPLGTTLSPTPGSQACLPSAPLTASPSLLISFQCSDPASCASSLQGISTATSSPGGGGEPCRLLQGRILGADGRVAKYTSRVGRGSVSTGASSGAAKAATRKKPAAPTLPIPLGGSALRAPLGMFASTVALQAAASTRVEGRAAQITRVAFLSTSPTPSAPATRSITPSRTRTPSNTPSRTPTPTPTKSSGGAPSLSPRSSSVAPTVVPVTPTPTIYPAVAMGSFTLSSLPSSAFNGTTPTTATLAALTSALSTSISAAGCTSCTAAITSITASSTGAVLYTSSPMVARSLGGLEEVGAWERTLEGSSTSSSNPGALVVGYRVRGATTASVAAVTSSAPSTAFITALATAVSFSFPSATVTVAGVPPSTTTSSSNVSNSPSPASNNLAIGLGVGLGLGVPILAFVFYSTIWLRAPAGNAAPMHPDTGSVKVVVREPRAASVA